MSRREEHRDLPLPATEPETQNRPCTIETYVRMETKRGVSYH